MAEDCTSASATAGAKPPAGRTVNEERSELKSTLATHTRKYACLATSGIGGTCASLCDPPTLGLQANSIATPSPLVAAV
eukprot:2036881-Pleurochrysis_carterae.AAC.1